MSESAKKRGGLLVFLVASVLTALVFVGLRSTVWGKSVLDDSVVIEPGGFAIFQWESKSTKQRLVFEFESQDGVPINAYIVPHGAAQGLASVSLLVPEMLAEAALDGAYSLSSTRDAISITGQANFDVLIVNTKEHPANLDRLVKTYMRLF